MTHLSMYSKVIEVFAKDQRDRFHEYAKLLGNELKIDLWHNTQKQYLRNSMFLVWRNNNGTAQSSLYNFTRIYR